MEGKVGEVDDKIISDKTKNGHQAPYLAPGMNDIPIKNIVTSESKTPLETPVREGDENQVKFMGEAMTEVNGEAKIDMDHVKACFLGMSKEELLQYVNDPFWVRMRMFLFVIFWITWVAMLVGAIAIIVVAPKCEPPKWHKQGPIYDVDINSFVNVPAGVASGLFKAFADKMAYLDELSMKGVVISPIFKTDAITGNDEDVVDFKAIDEKFGTLDDFKNLLNEAKSRDIHIILSMVPNHSSNKHIWFNKSVAREAPYDNYYIWAPSSGTKVDGSKSPPNNWLSVTGGSAWEWNDEREEFYLHQFDVNQPDLNFRNPNVLREFNETLMYWLNQGVSGFNLGKTQYLLEDRELEDEQISRNKEGVVHTDYNFYYHSKTYNLPENSQILSSWKESVRSITNSDGILMITGFGDITIGFKDPETVDSTLMSVIYIVTPLPGSIPWVRLHNRGHTMKDWLRMADYDPREEEGVIHNFGVNQCKREAPIPSDSDGNATLVDVSRSDRLSDLPRDFTVTDLYLRLKKLVQNSDDWPAFQLGDSTTRSFDHFVEEDIDGLNIITLLIKGTPIILSGQELGLRNKTYFPWANETESLSNQREAKESHFKIFKALMKARESKAVIYGSSDLTVLNGSVIALTRIKAGNPGYLAVYNLAPENVTTDLTSVEYVPEELMVYTKSLNYLDESINVKDKIKSTDFMIGPKSGIVFTFVPDIDENN